MHDDDDDDDAATLAVPDLKDVGEGFPKKIRRRVRKESCAGWGTGRKAKNHTVLALCTYRG